MGAPPPAGTLHPVPIAGGDRGPPAPPVAYAVCLDLAGRPGWQNMAIDSALLDRACRGERWLRLYRWAPHCLSFGRHEPARRRYDRDRIAELGLDVVRRPTGGRAVWHADELTYALAVPSDAFGSLRQAYEEIHRMLLDALGRLGVRAELAPSGRAAGVDAGACFASPAGGEIVIGGGKAVGSAQLREGAGLLQHGAILLAGRQAMVREITRGGGPPDRSAPLARPDGGTLEPREVAAAVVAAATTRWRGRWTEAAISAELLAESAGHVCRYRSAEWTWRA